MKVNRLLFLCILEFLHVLAHLKFKTPDDEEKCRTMEFLDISPNRVVSLNPMSWHSADICCKMKGRVLHTIEQMDEFKMFPLTKVLPEKFRDAEDMQFWIGLSFRDRNFYWTYGTSLRNSYRSSSMKEKYKWADGSPASNLHCVGISPRPDRTLEMISLSCNTQLNFICQNQTRPIEKPLSGHDMMLVGSAEFLDINGFDALKFSTVSGSWSVAKAICQSRNWAMIDHVHDFYGKPLFQEIAKKEFIRRKRHKGIISIHSAGNDFCEHQRWQWNCGIDIPGGGIPWTDVRHSDQSNKLAGDGGDKRCIQYFMDIQAALANYSEVDISAKAASCGEEAYIICDTDPACDPSHQYPCNMKEPYYVNTEETLQEEIEKCSNANFQEITLPDLKRPSYWMSETKFTWAGANKCCEIKGWKVPTPETEEDLEILVKNTIGASSLFCRNGRECYGIWTSTSTKGHNPFSPLRFPGGKVVPKKLITPIRADAFTYPSCGRINYLSFDGTQAKYTHAHCLEKNILVCEAVQVAKVKPKVMGRSIFFANERNVSEKMEKSGTKAILRYNQTMQDRFNSLLTPAELQARGWKSKHGRCLDPKEKSDAKYSKSCPNSSKSVFSISKKSGNATSLLKPSDEVQVTLEYQNRAMLTEMANSLFQPIVGVNMPETEPQSFQFLTYSAMIYSQLCPIIPSTFITKMFDLFKRLYFRINPGAKNKPDMMSKDQFKWTLRLLSSCQELVKPVDFRHDQCGDMIIAKDRCSSHICTDPKYESDSLRADFIVDFMWKLFEVAHAACFPAFQENPMLHHKFAMSVVDIWTSSNLRIRWAYQLASKKFWRRLLGIKFDIHLVNMERCNEAIIQESMFKVRLPRWSVPSQVRIKGFPYKDL